jgi:hypothetical protein
MEAVSIRSMQYVEKQLQIRKVETIDLLPKEIRKEIRKEAKRIATEDVFGVGHATAKDGTPIEQGIGAKGNVTQSCIEAYIKNQTERSKSGPEPGYEENLARMRKELAECEARRAAERRLANDEED